MVKEEGLAARLHYDDHERRSGLVRFLAPDVTPDAVAIADDAELGDFRDGDWQVDHLAPGPGLAVARRDGARPAASRSARRSASPAAGWTRASPSSSSSTTAAASRSRPALGLELSLHLLGGGGNPSAWYDVGGVRSAHDGAGAGRRRSTAIGYGNDWVGRRGRRASRAGRRRLVEPHRDGLQLGIGLRARLPGQYPAPVLARQDRARRDPPVRGQPARGRRAGPGPRGDRATVTSRGPGSRPAGSHEPAPPRRPRPLLPAVPDRPVHRAVPPDPSAAPFRDWNERITAECYRPNAERGTLEHASWNIGPTLTAYLAGRGPGCPGRASPRRTRRAAARRAGPGVAQSFHHAILPLASLHDRRTEIAWGMRDFEYRFGRRPRAMWLPETAVDLATLRLLAEAGVGATILAPWQADAPHLEPPAVPRRRRRRAPRRGGVLRREPVRLGLVRARRDRGRGPFARERVGPRLWAGARGRDAVPSPSSPATASCTATTSPSGTCSSTGSSPRRPTRPDRGYDVVTLGDRARGAAGPPPPRDPDPRPHLVELPPRGAPLVRRSARTPRTAAGRRRCARRSSGSPAASTPWPRPSRASCRASSTCGRPATATSTS